LAAVVVVAAAGVEAVAMVVTEGQATGTAPTQTAETTTLPGGTSVIAAKHPDQRVLVAAVVVVLEVAAVVVGSEVAEVVTAVEEDSEVDVEETEAGEASVVAADVEAAQTEEATEIGPGLIKLNTRNESVQTNCYTGGGTQGSNICASVHRSVHILYTNGNIYLVKHRH